MTAIESCDSTVKYSMESRDHIIKYAFIFVKAYPLL